MFDNLNEKADLLILIGTALFTIGQAQGYYAEQFEDLEDETYHQATFIELRSDQYCRDAPSPKNLTENEYSKVMSYNNSDLNINEIRDVNYESKRIRDSTLCLRMKYTANKMHEMALQDIEQPDNRLRAIFVNISPVFIIPGLILKLGYFGVREENG